MRKDRTSFVIKPSIKKKLIAYAKEQEESMSEIVQLAIIEYLKDKQCLSL